MLSEEDATVDEVLARADIAVAASQGQAPAPGLILRALAAGAVPLASKLGAYEEVLDQGQAGLLYDGGDVDLLAAQLRAAGRGPGTARPPARRRRCRCAELGLEPRRRARSRRVYDRLAAHRHDTTGNPELRRKLGSAS